MWKYALELPSFLEADAPLHGWTTFCLSIICQWIFVLLCFLAVVDNAV